MLKFATERNAARFYLITPVIMLLPCLLLVVALIASGTALPKGSFLYVVGGLSFGYVTMAIIWLIPFLISYAWFWKKTNDVEYEIRSLLNRLPLIISAMIWFPGLIVVYFRGIPVGGLFKAYLLMAFISLVLAYPFVWLVRLKTFGFSRFKKIK